MKLLDQIENKSAHQYKVCQECKHLFRPWPKKKEISETPDKSVKDNDTEEKLENKLTQQEQEELAIMDKLLNKAQKVQEKLKKKEETSNDKSEAKTKEVVADSTDVRDDTKKILNPSNHRCNGIISSKDDKDTPGNPQSIDRGVTKTASQQVRPAMKLNKAANMGSSKTLQNKVFNVTRKQTDVKSAGKRTASAHVKAPFQTNATLTVPKRSSTQQAMVTGRRPASARNKAPIKTATVVKKSSVPSKLKPVEQCSEKCKNTDNEIISVKPSEMLHENQTENPSRTEMTANEESIHSDDQVVSYRSTDNSVAENVTDKLGKMKVAADKEITNAVKAVQEHPVEKPFCLKSHGQNLKIPVKLRKCCATNDGLRKKLYMQRVTKKVDAPHKGKCFVDKLESMFTDPEVLNTARQFRDLLNSYVNLTNLFQSLQLDSLSEDSSVHEVLRARKIMEMILTCFSEIEEARLSIKTSVQSGDNFKRSQTSFESMLLKLIDDTMSGVPSCWLQSGVTSVTEVPLPLHGGVIQYRSHRDLQKYRRLLFQVQYQALQCHMMDYYKREFLPLLQSLDPSSSEYLHVLRSIYSLLSDGKSFMVVVKDTFQELEDSVIDTES
ncbi:hypothetical protein FSP39_015698 [Pinctada imbricata]|uniref:Uncharacterized protein n=1 Tax=Pinctada imbricata TaxID=66713 RepID=A0AA88Y7J3_PINIB|nr:hypothetical protein FSP39_015698 [Pinctada imbricata]